MIDFRKISKKVVYPTYTMKNQYESEHKNILPLLRNAFENRCAYCGIQNLIYQNFELDHFLPHKNNTNKKRKNDFNNIVYACQYCNRKKSDAEYTQLLNPSKEEYPTCFSKDELLNINIHKSASSIKEVEKFHNKMNFNHAKQRLYRLKEEVNELEIPGDGEKALLLNEIQKLIVYSRK